MLSRARIRLRHWPKLTARLNSTAAPTRSPKDLFNHLSQYVIGQEAAKKVLSVAVFNHYRRIEPRINPVTVAEPAEPAEAAPVSPAIDSKANVQVPASFEADYEKTNGIPDATRIVGAEDGADPTLTYDTLVREEKWSSTPGKEERMRKRKAEDEKREAKQLEEDARTRRADELNEAMGQRPFPEDLDVTVEKSNVLVVGPTGTGKTLMAKTLARALDVPFVSCDATTYTQAGYVGEDVESCILRLLQAADYDVARAEVGIVHIDEVDKLARRGGNELGTWGGGRDVGGEGVQQALLRILEGTTVTLSAKTAPIGSNPPSPSTHTAHSNSSLGPASPPKSESTFPEAPEWNPNNPMNRTFGNAPGKKGVRDGLPGFSGGGPPNKGDTYVVDTSNILFILSGAFVGLDPIIQRRLGKGSIGFGAPLSSPVVAGTLKPTMADLKDYGLIPEFLGRLPIVSSLHPLAVDDLVRILTEPRNALIKQYKALFHRYGSELVFTRRALQAIAQEGLDRGGGGARGLRGVLEEVLVDAMFEVPGSSVRYCLVTQAAVQRREPAMYFSRGNRHAMMGVIEEEDDLRRRPSRPQIFVEEDRLQAVG
ncbi:hypothetical protein CcaverHIS002_0604590 [Cutaneotrichosporon cavernicola]|nr:hypothetical protein CcaverHIS002_0604590 [Cutaneotrichosporon cavernicola]